MADNQTIIIKKIKKGGHGHHGGAWKVAYADFVTAMMAFFLLLWLLNATEAENLAGLADYFAPTVGLQGEMGIGFMGGKGALSKGVGADRNTNKGIVFGGVPTGPIMKVTEKFELETNEADAEKIMLIVGEGAGESGKEVITKSEAEVEEAVKSYLAEVINESELDDVVKIEDSLEGVEIQIVDNNNPMFEDNTAILTTQMKAALIKMSEVLAQLHNYISITGHTSSVAIKRKKDYSNWELSSDRANAARRVLISAGYQPEKISMVIGKSDNEPLEPKRPNARVNNRISIVLLRNAHSPDHKKSAPAKLFIDPESKFLESFEEEVNSSSDISDEEDNIPVLDENLKNDLEESDSEIIDIDEDSVGENSLSDGILPNKIIENYNEEASKNKVIEIPVNNHLFVDDEDEDYIDDVQEIESKSPFKDGINSINTDR